MNDILKNLPEWVGGVEEKPDFDSIFMSLAFVMAQRGIDPSTVHGSVIVSKDNRILSMGYNGPIQGSVDSEVPLTRPEKYDHLIHSEENAILNYYGSKQDLEGARIYITGEVCSRCLRMIQRKGIDKVIQGNVGSICVDDADRKVKEIMLKGKKIELIEYNDMNQVENNLLRSLSYIQHKKK